ncbi:hypothetical protein C3492_18140 [Streptomyces sp. Ru62]|nr:hypothetical protein C3492_18140 [Streptomyces sp. Ru62]
MGCDTPEIDRADIPGPQDGLPGLSPGDDIEIVYDAPQAVREERTAACHHVIDARQPEQEDRQPDRRA